MNNPRVYSAPADTMTTPALVREFARLKVWFVQADRPTSNELFNAHNWLDEVVSELRRRGVLD